VPASSASNGDDDSEPSGDDSDFGG
jgi:hypothetical protein